LSLHGLREHAAAKAIKELLAARKIEAA